MPITPIDPAFAVTGPECQVAPVAPADAADAGDRHRLRRHARPVARRSSPRPRTRPPRPPRRSPPARPATRPPSSWRSSARSSPCSSRRRSAPRPSRPSRTSSTRRSNAMPPFVDTFRAMPARSKAILAVSAVAIVGIAFLLLRIAGAPTYTMLSTGLDPAQTGKVTAALDEQGIAYELRNNGTALAVEKSQAAQARVAARRPGRQPRERRRPGLRAVRQAEARRLRLPAEGHLPARAGGRDRPHDRQRRRRQRRPGAARAARGPAVRRREHAGHGGRPARQLGRHARARRGARHRPARRLLRRGPQDRERHDHRRLRHRAVAAGRGRRPTAARRPASTAGGALRRALEADLNALLTRTLGAGKAQVSVSADLNADTDDARRARLRQEGRARPRPRPRPSACAAAAPPPAARRAPARNIPTYAASAAGGERELELPAQDRDRQAGVGKTVDRTQVAPGAVEKLNVALLVDKSVPAADFASIQQAVESAAGIDTARGDIMRGRPGAVRQGRGARRPARCRPRCSARSSRSASASPRCSSCSS